MKFAQLKERNLVHAVVKKADTGGGGDEDWLQGLGEPAAKPHNESGVKSGGKSKKRGKKGKKH